MKKRILSIVCAVAILATMLTVGIISSTAATSTLLSGTFSAAKWASTTSTNYINADGKLEANGTTTATVETIDTYNFGDMWSAEINIDFGETSRANQEPVSVKIGDLSAVVTGSKNLTSHVTNAKVELKLGDAVMGTKDLGETYGTKEEYTNNLDGILKLSYNNGSATVSFQGVDVISNVDVGDIDFSAAKAMVSIKANRTACYVNSFNFKTVYASSSAIAPSEVASSEVASSDVSSEDASSTAPACEKVVAEISGELVAEMWQESDNITDGVYDIKPGAKATLTSVKKYDLGTEWETSAGFSINGYWDQMDHRASFIKLGDVEIVSTEAKADKPNDLIVEDGAISLKIKGVEVQSVPVTYQKKFSKLELRATYKEGIITVYYSIYYDPEAKAITYDATSDALDFSETEIVVSSTADWSESCKIRTFGLKTADTYIEPGAPIVVLNEATFNTNDWSGDTSGIDATDGYFSPGSNTSSSKTITSKTAYYLKDGFKFAGKLLFKNSFNNYGGEYVSMYVGDPITGIELRIANVRGQGMYTGHILVKGEEVAKADLLNAPNGVYELVYKNGKLTVNLEGAAIKWTLADASTSTSVAINDVDLNKVTLGFRIAGNWSTAEERQWSNYSLSPVSGGSNGTNGTNGTTGDARNLVIPAVALVLGACAAAFVAKAKKANA